MDDFWTANGIALIALFLVMIAGLLMYIAFKLSGDKRRSSKSR